MAHPIEDMVLTNAMQRGVRTHITKGMPPSARNKAPMKSECMGQFKSNYTILILVLALVFWDHKKVVLQNQGTHPRCAF